MRARRRAGIERARRDVALVRENRGSQASASRRAAVNRAKNLIRAVKVRSSLIHRSLKRASLHRARARVNSSGVARTGAPYYLLIETARARARARAWRALAIRM